MNSMTLLGWLSGLVIGSVGITVAAVSTGYQPWNPPAAPHPKVPMQNRPHAHGQPALVHGQVQIGGRPLLHGILFMQMPHGPTIPVPVEGGHFHFVAPPTTMEFKVRCLDSGWESSSRSETLQSGPQQLRLQWEGEASK